MCSLRDRFTDLLALFLLLTLSATAQQVPGTKPLTAEGDIAAQMVEGIRRFLLHETTASIDRRQSLWRRNFSSREAYEESVASNRGRFRRVIGLIDERVPFASPQLVAVMGGPLEVARVKGYTITAVRWPVLPGVDAEGLLLEPTQPPVAQVVALPDADWSPEMLVGLAPGVPVEAQYARRLAENGCRVLVPVLIDRKSTWSGNPRVPLFTDETHREYIYRMAYEIGRHPIGFEVQKVLAAVDWFARRNPGEPLGVIGYGEGGLLALYSSAADTRIDVTAVSGYFQSRQNLWTEPIYRNVWALLHEFGDAEIASLIAPRTLIIEASRGPEVPGPPPEEKGRRKGATAGKIVAPGLPDVQAEFERARPFFDKLGAGQQITLAVSGDGRGNAGSALALRAFLKGLGAQGALRKSGAAPQDQRTGFASSEQLHRQFAQLVDFTQTAVWRSELVRQKFWSKADASSIEKWQQSTEFYRRYFWEEVIGRFPDPTEPLVARTRRIYDEPKWTGYEVMLPVWPDVFAYGILLLPKDLKPGERRPVVVCQHGLEGRPQDTIKPTDASGEGYYHRFAARLADRGFIVYSPQNPYIGVDKFRTLQRIANPLKRSLYSVIIGQHQRTLEWLSQLPFVDAKRIGFYGLSYGGKTAMRVPTVLEQYALSICSGDFNEWVWKVSNDDYPFTYVYTYEYEMLEFDFGNTFNYGSLASLMAPRPFMVERGHQDPVGIDEWVAYEYAKVRRRYAELGIPERTEIEFFWGPHTIHGEGTFRFLHRFLNWPELNE